MPASTKLGRNEQAARTGDAGGIHQMLVSVCCWRATLSALAPFMPRCTPARSRFQQAEPTHLGLGQESSGVRAPQRKIIYLAEFFEAIWGEYGHEHVPIPGSR
jgi:hypothetical protein